LCRRVRPRLFQSYTGETSGSISPVIPTTSRTYPTGLAISLQNTRRTLNCSCTIMPSAAQRRRMSRTRLSGVSCRMLARNRSGHPGLRKIASLVSPVVSQLDQPYRPVSVTWVGINDCAFTTNFTQKMSTLLSLQETLYTNGARNFLFVDVPPINRSPAAKSASASLSPRFLRWNASLHEMISQFAAAHSDVTIFRFSSWDTFTRIIDDPVAHGFPEVDVQKFGGSIWVDHIHPSSKVHDFVARDLSVFLERWPAFVMLS